MHAALAGTHAHVPVPSRRESGLTARWRSREAESIIPAKSLAPDGEKISQRVSPVDSGLYVDQRVANVGS
jgi:hypothetical protein